MADQAAEEIRKQFNIELPEDLIIKLKIAALERRVPVRQIVEDALLRELNGGKA